MDVSQLMRNMLRNAPVEQTKSLELRAGQVVRGVVMQVLQGQEAIVQIEGMQVRARLEAPLQQGQATFLQVQPETTGDQLILRPLNMPQSQLSDASLAQLLKAFGLKADDTNTMILQMMHREGIKPSAQQVQLFRESIDRMPSQLDASRWLQAAAMAHHKGLALSPEAVRALYQVMHGPALQVLSAELVQQSEALMRNGGLTQLSADTRQVLDQLLRTIAEVRAVLSGGIQASSSSAARDLGQANTLPQLQDGPQSAAQSSASRFVASEGGTQTLGPAAQGIAASQVTQGQLGQGQALHSNYQAGSQQALPSQPAPQPGMAAQAGLSEIAQHHITAGRTDQGSSTVGPPSVHHVERSGVQSIPAVQAGAVANQRDSRESAAAAQSQQAAVGEAVSSSSFPAKGQAEQWITRMLKLLGMDAERSWLQLGRSAEARAADMRMHDLALAMRPSEGATHPAETVKSLLLQLLSSEDIPQALRESAQQTLQHITGQQLLLTSDRNAAFTQITLFIPIAAGQGDQQAAIHIQSRKKDRNQPIDADNCRLIFDLNMNDIGDTLIDVQVVDRTVSIHLHNNHPMMPLLMASAKDAMVEAFEQLGYRCAVWKCEELPEKLALSESELEGKGTPEEAISLDWNYAHMPYKGVDLRI